MLEHVVLQAVKWVPSVAGGDVSGRLKMGVPRAHTLPARERLERVVLDTLLFLAG